MSSTCCYLIKLILIYFLNTAYLVKGQVEFGDILDGLLIPRVSGSANNSIVQNFIIENLAAQGWTTRLDTFTGSTPVGQKTFTNIIANQKNMTCDRLIFACHFDSKNMAGFLGATDSAVPCAMLIYLTKLKLYTKSRVSLELLFFDGEEAFRTWSSSDSLYGSRHLADLWSRSRPEPANCPGKVNRLSQIRLFVLLDLIGGLNPTFYNYFPTQSGREFNRLYNIQNRLQQNNLLEGRTDYFSRSTPYSSVDDDHAPFQRRGVPILHLIPSPFPNVWHKNSDNRENLSMHTIFNLIKILRVFIQSY